MSIENHLPNAVMMSEASTTIVWKEKQVTAPHVTAPHMTAPHVTAPYVTAPLAKQESITESTSESCLAEVAWLLLENNSLPLTFYALLCYYVSHSMH